LLVAQFVAVPVASAASPIRITADRPSAVPTGHNWTYNDFFPRTLAVHQNQTIQLAVKGFHTVTLLPAGVGPNAGRHQQGLLKNDPDDTTRNVNGSTHSLLDLSAAFPKPGGCGTSSTPCPFNGTSTVSTGAPLFGPVPVMTVKITAPLGTYRFICLVHPSMNGWLAVVANSKSATSASQAAAKSAAQAAADRRAGFLAESIANIARSHLNADGTRTWLMAAGTSTPDGHVAIDEMLPKKLNIHKGDKVVWDSRAVNEIHTVTFPTELHTDIAFVCEAGTVDTPAFPAVLPPTSPADFSCGGPPVEFENGGGNGRHHVTSPTTVSDSGVIASDTALAGFGVPLTAARETWKVSFVAASRTTYHYLCQVHAGMVGTIVVH
jgi:plastocyanin